MRIEDDSAKEGTHNLGWQLPYREAVWSQVLLQPTTLCNLNCSYCYLPDRRSNLRMETEIAEAVAAAIAKHNQRITVLWHGGEPLATGLEHLSKLVSCFEPLREASLVRHSIQTNATLIDNGWCDFFQKHNIDVGVSLDGPEAFSSLRVNWSGRPAYNRIMGGVSRLNEAGVPFSVICVPSPQALRRPRDLYEYMADLGVKRLGINIEEAEGLNRHSQQDESLVWRFWTGLFEAYIENPVLNIREFDKAIGWVRRTQHLAGQPHPLRSLDVIPSVNINGDVVLLSPEFMAAQEDERAQFVVGNVKSKNLGEILRDADRTPYIQDYWNGIGRCAKSCDYFDYCQGGHASNKFYENGSCDSTVTNHCRNSQQAPLDSVLSYLTKTNVSDADTLHQVIASREDTK